MSTKRERLERKLKSLFANRTNQLNVFRQFISGSNEYDLLHVTGIGGIGKTSLLKAYNVICDEEQIPWVLSDVGNQELPAHLIRFIHDQLTKLGHLKLYHLQTQLARHEKLDQKVRIDKDIPPDVLNIILTGMTASIGSDSEEPGVGTEQALNNLSRVLGGADVSFYLNPAFEFTQALLKDLTGLVDKQKICLMFDRYELISPYLDEWICRDLFPNLEENVFVVTSGRQPLPNRWQEWLPIVRVLELEPLTKEDTQVLVYLRGVTDEGAVGKIAEFAGGGCPWRLV